jgi:hypothetical protein
MGYCCHVVYATLGFIQKLKDKNLTEQQRKQAVAAVSIYYKIKKTDQGKTDLLKTKNKVISRKNTVLKLTNAEQVVSKGFKGSRIHGFE